ncbi:T9SS type A sorting domain-containing protein [Halocola ammonii]
MKKLYTLIVGMLTMTFAVNAQLADQPYSVETVMQHEGMVGNTDLTGYTTYRVYIHLQNQSDFVSAIYGDERADNTIPFNLDFTCDLYQHPDGAFLGNNVQEAFFDYVPEMEYDSWFSIGADNNSEGGALTAFAEPAASSILQKFNNNETVTIEDGAIFTLNDEQHPNGEAKLSQLGEKRVLIGQFTTCGDFNWCLNVQIFPSREGGEQIRESLCISSECVTNAAQVTWQATPATDENASNASIDYNIEEEVASVKLFKNNELSTELIATTSETEGTFDNLEAGVYFLELDKGQYCKKNSEMIDLRSGSVNVDENENENLNVSVYPNPGTGIYQLEVSEKANARYSVQDLQGRVIVTGNVNNAQGQGPVNKELDISSSANGTYIVKVYVNDEVKNIRLVKAD